MLYPILCLGLVCVAILMLSKVFLKITQRYQRMPFGQHPKILGQTYIDSTSKLVRIQLDKKIVTLCLTPHCIQILDQTPLLGEAPSHLSQEDTVQQEKAS